MLKGGGGEWNRLVRIGYNHTVIEMLFVNFNTDLQQGVKIRSAI